MEIWKENKNNGLSCGINDFGELFLGNWWSGYNLPDTPENREYIISNFDYWNRQEELTGKYPRVRRS